MRTGSLRMREGRGVPLAPEWERRDYIRDVLPGDDPHRDEVKSLRPQVP